MPTVYIETSVPSYYFETRTTAQIVAWRDATRLWWDRHRHRFDLCTSRLVLAELAAGPAEKARQCLRMLDGVRVLDVLPGMGALIDYYVENQLMPAGAGGDAGHLAFASFHGIDFLLTWNCEHLANANKTRHLQVLNARMGLAVPILTTPFNLLPEDAHNDQENSAP